MPTPGSGAGKDVFVFQHMQGFYIEGLTIDSQTYNAGDTIDDLGNDSTIQDIGALGAGNGPGTPVDRTNVFDLRVIAVCNANPSNRLYGIYHTGNIVNDVVLNGRGTGGNDDLDISCQHDDTISNIVDTGWGMALYIDQDVTVDNYSFTPGGASTDFRGWFVTASRDITINGFTTTGEGGRINSPLFPSSNITVTHERMEAPGYTIMVGDASGVVIRDSALQLLVLAPQRGLSGFSLEATTVAGVACRGRARADLAGITGVAC